MSLVIRGATRADSRALGQVGFAAWSTGIRPLLPPEVHDRVKPSDFADLVLTVPRQILVALWNGRPAGFAATEQGDDELSDLWVDPAVAGRGIGSALLHAADEVVRARGFDTIRLQVLTANTRAIRLYERHGYAVTWQGRLYDRMLGIETDDTHMAKGLD